ncbi:MAG TPA: AgmX/PglI C-terminal domain-containing protein [Polyangiaceae bacterium]
MRSIKQFGRKMPLLVTLLTAPALGVACSAGSTPPPEAAPDTAPEPEADPAAEDMQGALAMPEPEGEPATDPSIAEYEAQTAEGAATTGGSSLSDGETRTMKVIQQVVLDNRARFRACYDAVQDKEPEIQGDIVIHFVLDSAGRVREGTLNEARSTLKHPEVAKCIIGELRKVQFPASSKGLETQVNYPFNFNPK